MGRTEGACPQRCELQLQANTALQKLVDLTRAQLEAFKAHQHDEFMRLDKQLELSVGQKERLIGALRQHIKDHGCRR